MRTEGTHLRLACLHDIKRVRLLAALALRSEFQYVVLPHTFVSPEMSMTEIGSPLMCLDAR